ncbi:hypothetical protein FPZ12_009390 [Amycolatopsis acidicola]|uniref:Uncharacterized protein n=1 Tax=Amycolatopsis acidicola TaxID=2596893 RepID=A0A5N0V9Z3_9PSEU|nr:hypothetical protein [Amycolatopsis acidicola]KAA9163209.1 hypothetical protein FPZ12_009390 [Amycolatopsis acidicola]
MLHDLSAVGAALVGEADLIVLSCARRQGSWLTWEGEIPDLQPRAVADGQVDPFAYLRWVLRKNSGLAVAASGMSRREITSLVVTATGSGRTSLRFALSRQMAELGGLTHWEVFFSDPASGELTAYLAFSPPAEARRLVWGSAWSPQQLIVDFLRRVAALGRRASSAHSSRTALMALAGGRTCERSARPPGRVVASSRRPPRGPNSSRMTTSLAMRVGAHLT